MIALLTRPAVTIPRTGGDRTTRLSQWWPLVALVTLAAALRFSTLGLQSLWYDEAFTPVHTLHASLFATLRAVARTENTPPLWYVLEWAISRVFGTGAVALRSLSAVAGVLTVVAGWHVGSELAGRRTAMVMAGLLAVNPLFVWYSQEARAYSLFVLIAALAVLCFLRAEREPTTRRMVVFGVVGALALLTHYFAVFLLIPMIACLVRKHWRRALPAVAVTVITGIALLPLISAQGGHGTQWIGRWALASRIEAIPQYYLTGYSGEPLGHTIELLVALPILCAVLWGLSRGLEQREKRGALLMLLVAAGGIFIPMALVVFGIDYLAPRNLVAAMVPFTATLAVVIGVRHSGVVGLILAGVIALGFFSVGIGVDLSPRLQRGDWRGVAAVVRARSSSQAIVTVELGSAPLEYYLPRLRSLATEQLSVREVDFVGYRPLRPDAARPPTPAFSLAGHYDVHGLIVLRFTASTPRTLTASFLRRRTITTQSGTASAVLIPSGR